MRLVIGFFLVGILLFWIPVSATVLHVPSQYSSIQSGINASVNGDTVLVAPGIYTGGINFGTHKILLCSNYLIGSDTALISATIIDGINTSSTVIFGATADSTTQIMGFTIQNGHATYGGGIYSNGGSPKIRSNNIINNSIADHFGAGVYIQNSRGFELSDNYIASNSGGVGAIFINNGRGAIKKNVVYSNLSIIALEIYEGSDSCKITQNTFVNNYAQGYGQIAINASSYCSLNSNIVITSLGYGIFCFGQYPIICKYNDVWQNSGGGYFQITPGAGSISFNPAFNPWPLNEFTLQSNSPCIDGGDPTLPEDPDGTRADMGAYYFNQHFRTLWYVTSYGNDLNGNGSEASPFETIQHAINRSLDNDTVLVFDGHYYERINFKGKGITLASRYLLDGDSSHIQSTIIDGDSLVLGVSDSGSVVSFVNGEDSTTVLHGFTIINGSGTVRSGIRSGGGIYCYNGSSPSIMHCNILNNSNYGVFLHDMDRPSFKNCSISYNDSGGILVYGGVSIPLVFDSCKISENYGYGLLRYPGYSDKISVRFTNSIISNNTSTGIVTQRHADYFNCRIENNGGGGIGCYESPGIRYSNEELEEYNYTFQDSVIDCVIRNNAGPGLRYFDDASVIAIGDTIDANLGGITVNEAVPYKLIDCVLSNNRLPTDNYSFGGAISFQSDPPSWYFRAENCLFLNNEAGQGGAIGASHFADHIELVNCVFKGNRARIGGAISLTRAYRWHLISGCTFVGNIADSGSAISVFAYSSVADSIVINNSIFAFNGPAPAVSCFSPVIPIFRCTDIFGNSGGNWVDSIASQANLRGNFSADPMFCDTSNGDFTIRSSSPCAPANNTCNALIGALGVGCYEISDFHLLSPLSDSIYAAIPNAFVWSKSTYPDPEQDGAYKFYLDEDSLFLSPDSSGILTDTTIIFSGSLTRSQRYFWKVLAFIDQAPPKFSQETGSFYLDGYPTAPTALSPQNGSNADSTSAVIWLASTDPDPFDSLGYSLQIDSDSAFGSPIVNIVNVTPASISGDSIGVILGLLGGFEQIQANTTYYWRCKADDRYGLSSPWSNTAHFIFLAQISNFALVSPDSESVLNLLNPTFIWHKASHIDSSVIIYYKAYWESNLGFADSSGQLLDSLYQIPTELSRSRGYRWQIRAYGARASERLSSNWNFYINGFPTIREIIEPPNGTYTDLMTHLVWYASTDPDSFDVVSYTIQIDNDSAFASPEVNQTGLRSGAILDDAFAIRLGELEGHGNLQADTRYFWRVRADDNYGLSSDWTDGTNWFVFMAQNHPPNAPDSGFFPTGGEEVISLTPLITWANASDPDPDDHAENLSYTIKLSTDSSFIGFIYYDTAGIGLNQIQPVAELADNTRYFYEIKTIDDGGLSSPWSARQDFWTNHYNYPPEPFPLMAPLAEAKQVVANTHFTWGGTIDYDPNSSFTYSIQFSPDSSFQWIARQITGVTDTAISIATDTIALVGAYPFWRVVAIDDDGLMRIGGMPEQARRMIILPPGDANSSGNVTGLDVVYLVNYFKSKGPAPDPLLAGDANGSCSTTGLDVTYLVRYFKGMGPAPRRCGE
jgi:parallel beta-helix repeat protein